jgi:hypothetical protein
MNTTTSDILSPGLLGTTLAKCSALPWSVEQHLNGEPFILDAKGYVVTQVFGTIQYGGKGYIKLNRNHAYLICAAVNALRPQP